MNPFAVGMRVKAKVHRQKSIGENKKSIGKTEKEKSIHEPQQESQKSKSPSHNGRQNAGRACAPDVLMRLNRQPAKLDEAVGLDG